MTLSARTALRATLAGQQCVLMASVYDAISARLAERIGFEVGLLGGSVASCVVLGAPDLVLLTLTELADQVHRCTRASRVPLVVDADHGYGNALNVMRTIAELDAAGAAAVTVEDTLLPRRFGSDESPELVSVDEAVGKLNAAVQARRDSDILVVARTSATTVASIEETVKRVMAYQSTGVDALFLPLVRTRVDLDQIAAIATLPLIVGAPAESLREPVYLASRGARLWSGGHQTFEVAVAALQDAMQAVYRGTPSWRLEGAPQKALLELVTATSSYRDWTSRFLHRGST